MGFLPIALGAANVASGIMGRGQQAEADKQNMLANAAAIRYSPWTHMQTQMQQAQAPKGSLVGDVAGSVLSGIQQGQNNATADAQQKLLGAQKDWYNNQQFNGANQPGRQMGMMAQSPWGNVA